MRTEKEVTERELLLGRRMKLAAEQAGYKGVQDVGAAVGVAHTTVSRWWRGLQTPSLDDLANYARVMGKPVWWMYLEGSNEEFDMVADSLHRIIDMAMWGKPLEESYRQVTGDEDRFGRRERETLAAGEKPLRKRINQEAGGDWHDLPKDRQRVVLDRLSGQALHPRED